MYGAEGRHEEAAAAYGKSVGTFRELAKGSPAGYEPDLANSLTLLGIESDQLGQTV